jgi:hypothetical protein
MAKQYAMAEALGPMEVSNWHGAADRTAEGGPMHLIHKHRSYDATFGGDEDLLDLVRVAPVSGGESRTGQLTGTKALMLAVLEDGIRCYLGRKRLVAEEAEFWITSHRRHSPFSFVVVCETLGLDPEAVRISLQRMRAANVSPRQALPRSRHNVRVPGRVHLRKRRRRGRAAE